MNSVSDSFMPGIVAVSPATPRRLLGAAVVLLATAIGFYLLQNSGHIPGGGIAAPKVLWLAFALFYWFVLPLVFMLDTGIDVELRRAFRLFFLNMATRAVIELWMMYVSLNWHPYYGIAHDVFSTVLISVLLLGYARHRARARLLFYTLPIMGTMFIVETGFVFYLLNHVTNDIEPVYYVPDTPQHRMVLWVTWAVVALLSMHVTWLLKRGIHGSVER